MNYVCDCIVNFLLINCYRVVCGLTYALFKKSLSYSFVSFFITRLLLLLLLLLLVFFGEVHVMIF